jgi:Zn-dependent M16 (insulinase) family peptidase
MECKMTDDFPTVEFIYDRKILVDGSMVCVDKNGIVVGVVVSGDFPKGIVIGQQLPLAERREMEYLYQGITDHALIVALWEKLIENRPDLADALQVVRDKVNHDINDLVP